MGFFEELERKALKKPHFLHEFGDGVRSTIEALREMMVGEPMRGFLKHRLDYNNAYVGSIVKATEICLPEGRIRTLTQHHGTDGEEVYVVVVRSGEKDETHTDLSVLEATH